MEKAAEEAVQQLQGLTSSRSPPLPLASAAITYLRDLAVASAQDRDAAHPKPLEDSPEESSGDPAAYVPRLESATKPQAGSYGANSSETEAEAGDGQPQECLLCGGAAVVGGGEGVGGGVASCACSKGHPVCGPCLRQYVLQTHGLQVCLGSNAFADGRVTL